MPGPLERLRVLDLSRIMAGPYCTMILGDLGAEVIKVERPGIGDDTRTWGPPFFHGESTYFISANRNKKSLALNLASPKSAAIMKELTMWADVLVENFLPGTMEKFGLGYKALKEINPRLIFCSITAFGPDGPMKDKPGYDMVLSGIGGLMSITGDRDGNPVKVGIAITDVVTGIFAQGAIAAALLHREKTGQGQRIDLSLLEAQVAALINAASAYLISGKVPQRWGTAHASIVPYQAFRAKDKFFTFCVGNDVMWQKFCDVLGISQLIDDPRFATNPKRVEHREELIPILAELFLSKPSKEWIAKLDSVDIPVGPINDMADVFSDPQVLHRRMLVEVEHPLGKIKMAGIPVKYSQTKPEIRLPPPLLGEHTEEILTTVLGYSQERIAMLEKEGVIQRAPAKSGEAPWAMLFDFEKCSLCEICARECPTQALFLKTEAGHLELFFEALLCNGCEGEVTCEKRCPEKAIQMTQGREAEALHSLIRGAIMACERCGSTFAPVKKLATVQKKMVEGESLPEVVQRLCPECRRKNLVANLRLPA